ncbi:hypothetical protein [Microbacterium sp. TNHR37B]|uniref:hypothetical protein n=1 Tax=Microbacterium sp. TNHR37B TaxID=1775956 RepID=UPI0007B27B55|nr:hypothetical protein [Microbacterium sp. TNHR37B]KZE90542.1 hypothetical protein AVP41_00061 [Microbacterium sp. TNHR37B]
MPAWWEQLLHIFVGRVSRHDDLPDLRGLPSRAVVLERTHYLVNDRERHGRERRAYVLRGERDAVDVAVFSNGRGVGYLSARIAAEIRPLLTQIGGAAIVNGAGARTGSIRLWVDLPELSALREFVHKGAGHMPPVGGGARDEAGVESDRQRFSRLSRSG